MANYVINTFSQNQYSFRMYHNTKKKTWQKIKQETGCYGLINISYFNLLTYKVDSQTMIAGKWIKEAQWKDYGLCVDKNGYLTIDTSPNATYDYTIGLPTCYIKSKKYCMYKDHAENGVSFVGTTSDNSVVCLISSKDDGMTTAEACKIMLNAGCVNILRFDGSWSSQGSLGAGKDVDPSQERKAAVYLLIYKKGTEPSVDSYDEPSIIETIQSELNKRYNVGLVVDGSWGNLSKKAMIKAVQTEINKLYGGKLVVDGSWGSGSKKACPNVNKFAKNNLVWLIQACLAIKGYDIDLDGSYGNGTATIVKQFQSKNGLKADGICGANTMTKLLS